MLKILSYVSSVIGVISCLNALTIPTTNIIQQQLTQDMYTGALLWFVISAILWTKK